MQTYSLGCKKHTNNIDLKKVIMTNKTERYQDVLIVWLTNQNFYNKILMKKSGWDKINPKLFIH